MPKKKKKLVTTIPPRETIITSDNSPVISQLVAQSDQGNPKNETRKRIATTYVYSFLGIVGLTLAYMLFRSYPTADIKDILLAESAILSGPLGFIIGFYFKEELEKN